MYQTNRGVEKSTVNKNSSYVRQWVKFCESLWQDPNLASVEDPVLLLSLFAVRVRDGRCATGGKPVRAGTVSTALAAIGQSFSMVGAKDPRLDAFGRIDRRLNQQLRHMSKTDPPPARLKPIPIPIIQHCVHRILRDSRSRQPTLCCADMIIIAFFFLMRPGEYCSSQSEYHAPFRMCDVELFIGQRRLNLYTASEQELLGATFCKLTFSTQKNSVRGEQIGHGSANDPLFCPVRAVARRVLHIRQHSADTTTPMGHYYRSIGGKPSMISSGTVTTHLKTSASLLGPEYGVSRDDVYARSLRASGAMALLCARVDPDMVRLLGRWQSDAMIRYLYVQAIPIMQNMARRMLEAPTYRFNLQTLPAIRAT